MTITFRAVVVAVAAAAAVLVVSAASTASAADASFSVKVDAPAAKKAAPGKVHVHIAPGSGFHMNKDYPTSVTVVAPAGVTVEKAKLTAGDIKLVEAGADFDVSFTAADAGKKTFEGELKFAVCSATSCDPKKEKLSFVVEVK